MGESIIEHARRSIIENVNIVTRLKDAGTRIQIGPCFVRYEVITAGVCITVSLSAAEKRRTVSRTVGWGTIAQSPSDPLDFVARELATECQEALP